MSSFEPGGLVEPKVGPTRRWFFVSIAAAVLLVAVLALVAEPWFVFRRINRAVAESDFDVLRTLVDPALSFEQLRESLVLAHGGTGMTLSQGYDGPSRFLVVATPRDGTRVPGPTRLTFVLERHGLSWRLVDVLPHDALASEPDDELHIVPPEPTPDSAPPARPKASAPDTGEALPPYGTFVYVEELPRTIRRVAPEYPEIARKAGVSGIVMVNALVGRDGLVKDARVSRSIPMLDDAALEAVRQWRFEPARAHGKPVAVWVAVPVRFTLR